MKIQAINNNAFSGYKNVIANQLEDENLRLSLLSLQLDNENMPDLDNLKSCRESFLSSSAKKDCDIMSVLMLTDLKNNKESMLVDGEIIFSGDELKILKNKHGERFKKEYESIEKGVLKINTLLASITRRIMQNSLTDRDANITNVVMQVTDFLNLIFKDKMLTFSILNGAFQKEDITRKSAESINKQISKSMEKFFRY